VQGRPRAPSSPDDPACLRTVSFTEARAASYHLNRDNVKDKVTEMMIRSAVAGLLDAAQFRYNKRAMRIFSER
jgi:hypothetical protein